MDNIILWVVFFALIIYFIRNKNATDETKRIFSMVTMLAIVGLVFNFAVNVDKEPEVNITIGRDWQEDYRLQANLIDEKYLQETDYYDYSSEEIQAVIDQVLLSADSPEEATQVALDYIYWEMDYNSNEGDSTCFNSKASDILKRKTYQCDTGARLFVAIMRGTGIYARPVGGCVYTDPMCDFKFAVYQAMDQPLRAPQFTPLQEGDLSRGSSGLHAWAEVFLPDEGWVAVEVTSGQFTTQNCFNYLTELYPENDDQKHLCVTENRTFAAQCRALG